MDQVRCYEGRKLTWGAYLYVSARTPMCAAEWSNGLIHRTNRPCLSLQNPNRSAFWQSPCLEPEDTFSSRSWVDEEAPSSPFSATNTMVNGVSLQSAPRKDGLTSSQSTLIRCPAKSDIRPRRPWCFEAFSFFPFRDQPTTEVLNYFDNGITAEDAVSLAIQRQKRAILFYTFIMRVA